MQFRFLGTGISQGVPVIGCRCAACLSTDPLDRRLRTAGLVREGDTSIAIDIGPDFRQQMMLAGLVSLQALLITHEHSDHVAGLDDIRPYNWLLPGAMPLYAEPRVVRALEERFPYAFMPPEKRYPGAPEFEVRELVDLSAPFTVGSLEVQPFRVMHGKLPIVGYRFGKLAYITDCSSLPEESYAAVQGVEILVLNALRHTPHPMHLTLEEALGVIDRIGPRRAYLTHISHEMGLRVDVNGMLPEGVELGYDGLELEV